MISIIELRKSYDFEVLQGINLQLPDQGFVALIGESGSGKSTLLKCIGQLEKITSGEVWYGDKNLTSLDSIARESVRGRIFSYVSQSVSLIEDATVDKGLSFFHQDAAKRLEVLQLLGIADKKDEIARNLSGGERQRVAIAQALLRDTPVLLCDEITANLDPDNAEQVHRILQEISKDRLVVCVGHNPKMLAKYADRIITIKEGEICEDNVVANSNFVDKKSSQSLGKKTSLGISNFFHIFSWGFSSKLARIIFCAIFLFVALSSFCFGITQIITGTDGLIRTQALHLGVDFVKIDDYQQGSYLVANSIMDNDWRVFVDFNQERDNFELVEGTFPTNDHEVIITQFMAQFENKKVGDSVYIVYDDDAYKVSGIFKSDVSAYPFDDEVFDNFIPYSTLTAVYFSIDALPNYEDNVVKGGTQDIEKGNYIQKYDGQSILAGRGIDADKREEVILVGTGYVSHKYGYDIRSIKESPDTYFANLDKKVDFNGRELTIVGLCDNDDDYAFFKEGSILQLDESVGYVMPVDQVNKDNFYEIDFISTAVTNNQKWSTIGMSLFAIFAILSVVLFINLNVYEIDEKRVLFSNMRQAGVSTLSLYAYTLVVDMVILAVAFIFFLLVSLPTILHFQKVDFGGIEYYIYVFNGWSILIALAVMAAVAILSYLTTLPKFSKEISVCSKS